MADLGNIVTTARAEELQAQTVTGPLDGRAVVLGDGSMVRMGFYRDEGEGSTAVPSLRMARHGAFSFTVPVRVGTRRVSAKVRQTAPAAPRPRLVVRANPEVGLGADVVVDAAAGTDWQTLTANFTAAAIGAVWIELWCMAHGHDVKLWWDDLGAS